MNKLYKTLFLPATFCLIIISFLFINPSQSIAKPASIGKIRSVNKSKNQVIVQVSRDTGLLNIGDRLAVISGNNIIVLKVTNPMSTAAKCTALTSNKRLISNLKSGMIVYKYSKTLLSDVGAIDGKVILKVLAYGNTNNDEGRDFQRIVKAFEKQNPDINIKYEMLYDEAYHRKVAARLAAGDIPDIAFMGADARWGAPWKESGQQFNHKPFIDRKKYEMRLIPAMGDKGEIFEIPLGTSNICTVLFANSVLLKKLDLNTPKTYKDMVKMVPKAKKAGIEVVSINGADGWAWGSCLLSCIVARMSGDLNWVQKAQKGQVKFTDPSFVNSLRLIKRMVDDGVINSKSVIVDYGTNISNYTSSKTLFMIQGQWAAHVDNLEVRNSTKMLAWPVLPGQKGPNSVAAAIQVGYGMTKKCGNDPVKRKAALKFINFFNSPKEVEKRLKEKAIVAPILKNYQVPRNLEPILKEKVKLARSTPFSDVIDAYISGAANDAINSGVQKIVQGRSTPEEVAKEVQRLWDRQQ